MLLPFLKAHAAHTRKQNYSKYSDSYKHLSVKHRETLDSKSALFNGFFTLEKLSIFETLGIGQKTYMLNYPYLLYLKTFDT